MYTLNLDPVAFSLGSIDIRWYGIAYVVSFILGQRYAQWLNNKTIQISPLIIDRFITWVIMGVIIGGRLGYVLFYEPEMYWQDPINVVMGIRKGGMSFHGGCLGVILATGLFAKRMEISFLKISDLLACAIPIGLFLGRLANFINGENFGRLTHQPWGVIFPHGGPFPRHPSQLYEALTEGLLLGIVLFFSFKRRFENTRSMSWGRESGLFLLGYGIFRIFCEYFREPDWSVGFGYLWGNTTYGQWLSLPLVIGGLWLFQRSKKIS